MCYIFEDFSKFCSFLLLKIQEYTKKARKSIQHCCINLNTLMLDVVELLRSLYFWYLLPKTRVSSNHSTTKYVTFFKKGSSHVRFIATVCCCCSFWHWKIFASVIHCCPSSFFFQVPCRCCRQIELNFVQHILSKDRNHKSRRMWAQWARKYPFLYCNPQFCKWE